MRIIPHYEYSTICIAVCVIALLLIQISFMKNYCYVTEKELDVECDGLKPDKLLYPTLIPYDPFKK